MRRTLTAVSAVSIGLWLVGASVVGPAPEENGHSGITNLMPLASYRFRDRFYLCSLAASNFIRGPYWQSESAEPPLSPRSALVIAERHAWPFVPDAVSFRAQEIVLKRLATVWFYIVELEPVTATTARYGGQKEPIKIVVLMDGTVSEAVEQYKVR